MVPTLQYIKYKKIAINLSTDLNLRFVQTNDFLENFHSECNLTIQLDEALSFQNEIFIYHGK